MNNKKHTFGGFAGKGYYIALILCAAAIGISGYLYYRNSNAAHNAQLKNPPITAPVEKNVEVIATEPQATQQTVPESSAPAKQKPIKTTSPVQGETVSEFAMDCLSYNATTCDWRVHNGIDIAAQENAPVVAAADGTVYTVYEDDTMGTTVVIRHDGGYTTRYASLAADPGVAPGDTVSMGQTIGAVGTSALLESALGPHVHFAVTLNDSPVDPEEFLKLG